MADFPSARYHLPIISSWGSLEAASLAAMSIIGASPTVGATGVLTAANTAVYCPFRIWAPYPVHRLWWANGAAVAGNADCGIYSVGGTRLVSAGSTAQAGTTTIQTVTITELVLSPGSYYMAFNQSDVTTAQYIRTNQAQGPFAAAGWAQENVGAVALPATATFAAYAFMQPLFGIASITLI